MTYRCRICLFLMKWWYLISLCMFRYTPFFALVSLNFVRETDTVDKAFICYYALWWLMTLDVAQIIRVNLSSWCQSYLIFIRKLTIRPCLDLVRFASIHMYRDGLEQNLTKFHPNPHQHMWVEVNPTTWPESYP